MHVSRRSLLIGGGVGVGLVVGWSVWPRRAIVALNAAPGEHAFNAFVKIGIDGHVTVVVPQVEMGQGVYTTLPQIVADELGADWRTIGVEAAPVNAVYANHLVSEDWAPARWSVARLTGPSAVMATGGSNTVAAFEDRLREAAAAARALLCSAAARRWDAAWDACDTAGGFVIRGDDRMRFGDVAAEAATLPLPDGIARRSGPADRLVGRSLARLDAPAKVDGSAQYAADIRLPDMVYASIAQGPLGDTRLKSVDRKAAEAVPGVLQVIETDRWAAVVATNWWSANHAVASMRAVFTTDGAIAGDRAIDRALDAAFAAGTRIDSIGDVATSFAGADVFTAEYRIGLAAHAAIEPMSATAWLDKGALQLWIGTQVPGLAARAAGEAIGLAADKVIVHPMLIGGAFGRRFEIEIAGQAAKLAALLKRPVQLTWSRAEDMRQDRFRAAGVARIAARLGPGRIDAWLAKYACPASANELHARVRDGMAADAAMHENAGLATASAVLGGVPPYRIPNVAIDHHPAMIGVPTGDWRGRSYGLTCFATECFIDEIAARAGIEPFSFRMGLLGDNPRLAACLSRAAALGAWNGGAIGTAQGLACFSMAGSHIAVMAAARIGSDGRVRVAQLTAVVDCGAVINPDIVRQQIGGGLIFGMTAATGAAVEVERGQVSPLRIGDLGLPRLADTPHITIELLSSAHPSGGVGELAVPPVAPAIANALFASAGTRYRTVPLLGRDTSR